METRNHYFLILLLLLVSCTVRLLLFSGFVLGDDPAYADYTAQILNGTLPIIGTHGVFACRPLMLYPIALCIKLFGWFDWSFVLPVLLASLFNTALAYAAGARLAGSCAGFFAAAAYSVFPLDVVHATTMSNDILLSSFIWSGGFLLMLAMDRPVERWRPNLICLSGFLVGAGMAVKFNAVIAPVLFMGLLMALFMTGARNKIWPAISIWAAGWLTANILLCLYLYKAGDDFFAHYHAEMRFNIDYNPSGFIPGPGKLAEFLLRYPKWMLGILKEGGFDCNFLPYGYFFLVFLLCAPVSMFRRFKKMRLPVVCALFYLLFMEFSPLKINPQYVPIHRLPRFLHIASVPAAVAIGVFLSCLWSMQHKVVRLAAAAVFVFLIVSSLYWAWVKASFYRDTALDQQWAWNAVKDLTIQKIITDAEMRHYLLFRAGFHPKWMLEFPKTLPSILQLGSVVITGGARRPDMLFGIADTFTGGRLPASQCLMAEAPFPLKPWRISALRIYRINSAECTTIQSNERNKEFLNITQTQHAMHAPGLKKVAELNVGNPESEKRVGYRVENVSWEGTRAFSYADDTLCTDDGKAHIGSESFVVSGIVPHKPITIIKRFDSSVANQVVAVAVNGQTAGDWHLNRGSSASQWQESMFTVPASLITTEQAKLSFSFVRSAHDINSFYYWVYQ
ncbi:MAG: glycosyltransferase family 39 protein [Deltaproteobacteria bacterium]|nr:glycosyltransferase family 39 protein [Deltaproteobacteria bacterium]